MGTTASVWVDEIDVTSLVVEGSVTKRLNNVGQASARFNMKGIDTLLGAPIAVGMLMKVYFDTGAGDVLYHHGRIMICEVTAEADTGYVVVNSADPLELWRYRPVRDPGSDVEFTSSCGISAPINDPGDFSKPDILADFVTGPNIVEAMCFASENIALGADDAEGPLFLAFDTPASTFECNGADLSGAPKDWPMTMMELASLLTSTGELDIVCQPIELDVNGNYGRLSAYNGDFGTDLTATVTFSYGMGTYNVRSLRWNTDMTKISNKLWYFLGPKCDDQHWYNNITATAGTQFAIVAVNIGTFKFTVTGDATGYAVGDVLVITGSTGNDGTYTVFSAPVFAAGQTEIEVNEVIPDATADGFIQSDFWTACGCCDPACAKTCADVHAGVVACEGTEAGEPGDSRGDYGVRMDIKIMDGAGDNSTGSGADCVELSPASLCLWKNQWLREANIRCLPQTIVHVTPQRDTGIGTFDIGDLITVEAQADVNGGFSGGQRVYAYTISWDSEDSVPALGEIQVSSDQENF